MPRPQKVIAGIAWFRPDQWQLLRSVAVDADKLEQTHADWEALAEKAIRDLGRQGVSARKVSVDVSDLVEWCRVKQRPLDASARAEYAVAHLRDEKKRS
jgi:hypothetical protein